MSRALVSLAPLLVSVAAGAAPTAPTTSPGVADALLGALEAPGFETGAAVALSVTATRSRQLERDLEAALAPRLRSLGARHVHRLAVPEPSAARAAGAEYWVHAWVASADGELVAGLRVARVDAGLWRATPAPELLAEARLRMPRSPRAPPPPRRRPAPRRAPELAAPVPVLDWPRPIYALGLCPGSAAASRLVLVDARSVAVIDLDGPRPRVLDRASLEDQRPARTPIRAPYGVVRCGEEGRAAIGHGRLERGLALRFHPDLELGAELPGFPVGWRPGGWWTARPLPGRPGIGPDVEGPGAQRVTLEAPVLELWLGPEAPEGFAVTLDLDLRRVLASGAFGARLGPAGLGLAVAREARATTAASAPERIRVRVGSTRAVRGLAGPARVLALGRARGGRGVLAAVDAPPGARLFWLRIEETR
jgi:hypothetical protein